MIKKKVCAVAILLAVIFALTGTPGAFALDVTGTAPQVGGSTGFESALQTALNDAWDNLIDSLGNNEVLKNLKSKPEDLIKGFGTSSIYASQGATQRGYGQPKYFTFTVGSMVGIKTGTGVGGLGDYFNNISGELEKGDIDLGLNVQAISGQFNLNMSSWLVKKLDLGVRFGYFKLEEGLLNNVLPGFAFDTFSIGLVANYQLFQEQTLVPVVLKWRGLSLGTGLIYQKTNMGFGMDLGLNDTVDLGHGASLKFDPKLTFNMETDTVTIPIEATTAIQLLSFLNITLGAGADLGFGTNKLNLGVTSDADLENLPSGVTQTKAGNLKISSGGEMPPQVFNFKLMTGVGFKFGPVILDVPLTWYPGKDTGLSLGVTMGFTL
ncbi:hypothetical protein FACS1894106_2200 [Spirochaetia bacterium]|nr:hypothetical protein FACS1894106_2200 [Spirochaetia bacterium]